MSRRRTPERSADGTAVAGDVVNQINRWRELAQQLRVDSIRASSAAGSGHPTSSLSAADLMAVLMSEYLRYDFAKAKNPANDHLIFSKGHATPLLYSMYRAAGAITEEELFTFRRLGSRLQGHPSPVLPWVDVATGSLGQGLPIGVGIALAGKYLDRLPYRVWVLCGDSEMAEGSVWEAFELGGHYRLDNLVAIVDMNRLGQRGETMLGWDGQAYAARARAFGWHAIEVDGHDVAAINAAYAEVEKQRGRPVAVIARTVKGQGVTFLEDQPGWHGRTLDSEQTGRAIQELGGERGARIDVRKPEEVPVPERPAPSAVDLPRYEVGSEVATRAAYGDALEALGAARQDVVALDGEVSNSTYAERFAQALPDRFFEMYIAEQQMVAAAVGLGVRGYVAFASSFAAFLTRAHDFLRMAAISRANVRLSGSHAGVSIGEDGPSQMGLEDLAMFRALPGSTVLYPSDPNQTAHLLAAMADRPGISYLRTTRGKTPVLYPPDEPFTIGGSRILRGSEDDRATIVAAGITVHEALKACDELRREGIAVRLIDAYSVKPIDEPALLEAVRETGGRVVVVEDHHAEGGLGEAVLAALTAGDSPDKLAVRHLAVRDVPGSGTPEELLDAAGIAAPHIARAVRDLLARAGGNGRED
ncbi:MAG: transketolase [Chloroflexota bacterium]